MFRSMRGTLSSIFFSCSAFRRMVWDPTESGRKKLPTYGSLSQSVPQIVSGRSLHIIHLGYVVGACNKSHTGTWEAECRG